MVRSLALPTAIVLLAFLAGCTGSPGADVTTPGSATAPTTSVGGSPTQAPETRTTIVPSRTVTAGCPYFFTVEPATDGQIERAETTLDYGNLSAPRQTEFDRARTSRNETITLETLPRVWSRPRVVEYEGDLYATVASTC